MNRMKSALMLSLGITSAIVLASCNERSVEPQAEIGWNGQERIVRVTDNSGQQFLMNYLLYSQLLSSGGYNNVIHHYYANPTGRGYYKANTRFTRATPLSNFSSSYRSTVARNKVYSPTSNNVSRARRSATYVRASKIYSSKPSSSSWFRSNKSISYKSSSSRRYSSPSRSIYRSSFRSSFRSGRR